MGDCDCIESLDASIPLQVVQEEAKKGGNVRIQWQPSSAEGVKTGIVISKKGEEKAETGSKRPRLDVQVADR
jgi:hypothetical protein